VAVAYRVEIDRESCQSSGRCVQACPDAFALDDDHLACLRRGVSAPDARLAAIARDCPALAIHLFEEDGTEVEL
jgi:ferredoxin